MGMQVCVNDVCVAHGLAGCCVIGSSTFLLSHVMTEHFKFVMIKIFCK